jgi:sugar phosphate isomerase/epimerase
MKIRSSLMLHWETEIREMQIEYALANRLGLEVVGISWPPLHNDMTLLTNWIIEYKSNLRGFPYPLSFHGPIADIIPHSEDAAIKAIAEKRVRKSIEVAQTFNANRIVFHSGINPVITDPNYYNRTIKKQSVFWRSILDDYKDMTICIENMWENNSSIFKKLIEEIESNRMKLCFDTGHFNVYAKSSLEEWFESVGSSTIHFHLHDNPGDWDRHSPIGEGTFCWKAFAREVDKLDYELCFVHEVMTIEEQKKSIKKLKNIFEE